MGWCCLSIYSSYFSIAHSDAYVLILVVPLLFRFRFSLVQFFNSSVLPITGLTKTDLWQPSKDQVTEKRNDTTLDLSHSAKKRCGCIALTRV